MTWCFAAVIAQNRKTSRHLSLQSSTPWQVLRITTLFQELAMRSSRTILPRRPSPRCWTSCSLSTWCEHSLGPKIGSGTMGPVLKRDFSKETMQLLTGVHFPSLNSSKYAFCAIARNVFLAIYAECSLLRLFVLFLSPIISSQEASSSSLYSLPIITIRLF